MSAKSLIGGPHDGGYVVVGLTTPQAIFCPNQPKDRGWDPNRPVRDEHLRTEFIGSPASRWRSRYLFSPKSGRYLFDGIVECE